MVVGQLEIQLLANMARLISDMDKAKRTVSDTVAKMNKVLETIGVGISIAGFTALIKGVVDVGDRMNDLRKITGLTVEQLAGIDKAAALNGTNLDQVAKAVGIMAKNMVSGSDGLQKLSIASREANGDFRSTGDVLLDVADRFSRMKDGVQKAALAQEIFGKSGRELIPLLNEGRSALQSQIETYGAASGMTTKLAADSDRFNDILSILGGKVTAVKNTFVGELLPTLINIGNAMLASGQATDKFSFAASVVVPVIKALAIAGFTVVDTFRGMGREIGARAAQLVAFANLDFSGAKFIGTALAEDNKKSRAEYDKFVDTIMNGDKAVEQFTDTQREYLKIEQQIPGAVEKTSRATEKKNKAFDMQLYLLKQYDDEARRARDITQSVATEQEIYNQKLEELNRLKPYLAIETYDRALAKLNVTNKQVVVSTQKTTDEMSQLWMQAGRNIQSTLANSIFNFFDDGLKGMLKNVISTVGRIASEFAALRLAQGIGLSSMFAGGVGGTGANLASGAFNIASMGKGMMSMMNSIPSAIGRGIAMLPGSMGAFGTGMMGGAGAGAFSAAGGAGTAFIGGAGTALGGTGMGVTAGLGASAAAMAGPLAALAAGFMGGKLIAGKNKIAGIGGTEAALIGTALGGPVGAVVAGAILKLFGRGPFKFRQQSLQGTISGTGLEGDLTNVDRAKGGLFRSNAHRSTSLEIPREIQELLDTTISGFYKSTHGFAVNMGLSTDLVDNFSKEIQIKSEKGKTITAEAIQEMLGGIGNDIARNLLPTVDTFSRLGEDAMSTLTRLNSEFVTLKQGAINLGASAEYANKLISDLAIGTRSAYIDAAGGPEALLELTAKFNANFLTEAERMAVPMKFVEDGLRSLGYSADITKEQFGDLIQSLTLAGDATALLLLQNQDLFLLVDSYKQSLKPVVEVIEEAQDLVIDFAGQAKQALSEAFSGLQRSVEAERKKITDKYNAELGSVNTIIQGVSNSISKLTSFTESLKSTVNDLAPMDREFAKRIVQNSIKSGKFDSQQLQFAIGTLKDQSTSGFKSSFEFAREQAKSAGLLTDLGTAADAQLTEQQALLAEFNNQRLALENGFRNEIERLDSILVQAQLQLDATNGLNTTVGDIVDALKNFNLASVQSGGGAITDPGSGSQPMAAGNRNISNQAIIDYFKKSRTPEEIYRDAIKNGVSSRQIVNTGRFTQAEADKFFRDNPNIPKFAAGGYHRGGLRIVGEYGPELERTGASNITSNSDMKETMGISEVIQELKDLKKIFAGVTQGGTAFRTKAA